MVGSFGDFFCPWNQMGLKLISWTERFFEASTLIFFICNGWFSGFNNGTRLDLRSVSELRASVNFTHLHFYSIENRDRSYKLLVH